MADNAVGIKDLLETAGVGVFAALSGWSIAISKEPQQPDTVVTVYNTGGPPPNPRYLLDFPNVQVRVRGGKGGYEAAQAKAQACKDALLGIPSQVLNGDNWNGITMQSDVMLIGYDETNRPIFTMNFSLIIEPATGANRVAL